jgi:plasmid stability protein
MVGRQEVSMPSVTIRQIEARVLDTIRATARRRGRSMEAELRSILEEAAMDREAVLADLEQLVSQQSRPTTAGEVDSWLEATRGRSS